MYKRPQCESWHAITAKKQNKTKHQRHKQYPTRYRCKKGFF